MTPSTPRGTAKPGRLRQKHVWAAAILFAALGLLIQWWRIHSLTASYDQGIFTQVLWNGLHGHPDARLEVHELDDIVTICLQGLEGRLFHE